LGELNASIDLPFQEGEMQIAPGATPLFEKDQVFESNLAG
jgi:hypothetical protein